MKKSTSTGKILLRANYRMIGWMRGGGGQGMVLQGKRYTHHVSYDLSSEVSRCILC